MEHTSETLRLAVIAALETEADRVSTKRHLGQYIQEETGWYYKAVARVAAEMVRRLQGLDLADLPPDEAAERIRAAVSGHDDPFGWGGNWSDSVHDNAVGHLRALVEKILASSCRESKRQ